MSKQVTVAAQNRYCRARLEAGKCNEELMSRVSATKYLPGVTEDSLKKYELGITRPPNDIVAIMADAYNQPELINWYCANECPLGKGRVEEITVSNLEATSIRLHQATKQISDIICDLFEIVSDGKIDDLEWSRIKDDKEKLKKIKNIIEETLAAIEKKEHSKKRK